jgi:Na+/H+ antiporter NhaC
MVNQDGTILRYRGGLSGAFAPLALFIAGVAWLGISGAPREAGFWPILVAAITLGMLLCRDRTAYSEAVIEGMSQPINMIMIMAWLLAGILAEVMKASGFVSALIFIAENAGLSGGGWVLASFLIACAVSFSTGTSLGTLILCTPLLYPAGGPLGADPAMLIGAILGGATFGDNLSPVSDTTIASSVTQGAKLGAVVKTRLRYAIPAAIAAGAVFFLGGGGGASADPALAATAEGASHAASLPMVLAPIVVIVLLLKNRHLLEGLLLGNLAAMLVALGLGLVSFEQLIYLDLASYGARGILVEGMEKSVGIAIFTLLLMGMVAGLETSGYMQRLLAYAERKIHTARSAEWWAFGTVSIATLLTTHSIVALLSVSRFVRETGARNGVGPNRRANLLDTTVCTYPFLLPYCIPTILAGSLTSSGAAYRMPIVSALDAGFYNFHSWALLAMVLFAISTGWGRTREDPAGAGAERPMVPVRRQGSSATDPFLLRFEQADDDEEEEAGAGARADEKAAEQDGAETTSSEQDSTERATDR